MTNSARSPLYTTQDDPFGKAYRGLREVMPGLPAPLGKQVKHCLDAIDDDDPIAAVWYLKDAAEVTARLLFVVGSAEVLRLERARGSGWLEARGDRLPDEAQAVPESVRELAHFIRHASAPSFGALVHHVNNSIIPNAGVAGPGSTCAVLKRVWERKGGGPGVRIDRLRAWRNRFHGHGALGDARNAATQLIQNLEHLDAALEELGPVWPGLRAAYDHLLAVDVSSGEGLLPLEPSHADAVSLRPLAELLEVPGNQPRAVWLFDSADERRATLQYRNALELTPKRVSRATVLSPELTAIENLAEDPEWRGRTVSDAPRGRDYEAGWLQHLVDLRFAGYEGGSYTEPKYLRETIESRLISRPSGAERIVGPAGSGKSFLVRGLVDRWRGEGQEWRNGRHWVVLPYFAVPGCGAEEHDFLSRTFREAGREVERLARRGCYLVLPDEGRGLREDGVGDWLREFANLNRSLERVVLIVDGLDEIRPASRQAALTALLPRKLPDRVFLLLSGRDDEEIHPDVRRTLAEMPFGADGPIRIVTDGERGAPNTAILKKHLKRHYPELAPPQIDRVLEAAQGRFLYVETLARGIREGAFGMGDALPGPGEIVVRYVRWLAHRMHALPAYGRALQQTVAFLAAAVMPVPIECLVEWGIDERWIEEILLDLKGVLVRERQDETALVKGLIEPYTYRLFHRDVVEHLVRDVEGAETVDEAGRGILRSIVDDRRGLWGDEAAVSWENPADAYAMLTLGRQLSDADEKGSVGGASAVAASDVRAAASRLLARAMHLNQVLLQPGGALSCLEAARTLQVVALSWAGGAEAIDVARLKMAIAWRFSESYQLLLQNALAHSEAVAAETLARELEENGDVTPQSRRDVSFALNKSGSVLQELGNVAGARRKYEEAEGIRRDLLTKGGRTPEALRDLWVSLNYVGGILLAEGDHVAARSKYEESESICRELLEDCGRTAEVLRDLSVSLISTGNILAEGDRATARLRYLESESICREGLERYGRTPERLRNLSASLDGVGDILLAEGDRATARSSYEEAEAVRRELLETYGRTPGALNELSRSLHRVGDILMAEGDRVAARSRYEEFESICRDVIEIYGRTPRTLRDLSLSLIFIGDSLAEGDRVAARSKYEESESIRRELLETHGRTPQALRDLSVSLNRVGGILLTEGDRVGARSRFQQDEVICRELLRTYGRTPEVLGDLAVALNSLGDTLLAEGNHGKARSKYEESESIRRELLATCGRTPRALRALSVSLNSVGNILLAEGDRAGARSRYQEEESISRELLDTYGHTPEALRDLSVSLNSVAGILLADGDRAIAQRKYEEAERIDRLLLARYGRTAEALSDLSVSLRSVGDVLLVEGDRAEARSKYQESESICHEVLETYGRTPMILGNLLASLDRVGDLLLAEGDDAAARAKYEESQSICYEVLAVYGRTPETLRNLAICLSKAGDIARAEGRRASARWKYEESESIFREVLEMGGPTPRALHDLSVSLQTLVDVLLAEGDSAGASVKHDELEAVNRELRKMDGS